MATAGPTWWLSHQHVTHGPFTHAYIAHALAKGEFTLDTQACQVGTNEWKSLRAWNLWNPYVNQPPPLAPVVISASGASSRFERAKQRLPDTAHWIALYGIYAMPALWFIGNVCCFIGGPTYVETSPFFSVEILMHLVSLPIDLAFTILSVTGGIYLRQFRQRGRTLLIAGLGGSLIWGLLLLAMQFGLSFAAASDASVAHFVPNDETQLPNAAAALTAVGVGLMVLTLVLATLAFQTFAVFWLLLKGKRLPLR